MSFARASIARGVLRASRVSPIVARPQTFQQISRRAYSQGHAHKEAGSDLPWIIGSIGVTVPSLYFVLSGSGDSHGHEDHGDSHAKDHKEEESHDEPEEKSEEPEAKEDSEDDSEKPESKDDKKDEAKVTAESEDGNTKKHIPDAKGGAKKRLESEQGEKQGEVDGPADEGAPKDQAAASKPTENPGTGASQSSKQEGLSNTDTKHSTDITNNPDKSSKGEGAPETAKLKGTVDPKRPQPESE